MVVSSAQYAYANDCSGVLTHISNVINHNSYTCPGCREEMVAVKGKVNLHHFRHNNATCSYESYLHNAAKNAFYNRFNESTGLIVLMLERAITCQSNKKSFLNDDSISCSNLVEAKYNLRNLFNEAFLELYDKSTGFTPDVMLSNSDNGSKCYIEVFVTHECSEEKIASGIPIIEISVNDENDIKYIQESDFSTNDINISLYNFSAKEKSVQECHQNCSLISNKFETWTLSASGRLNKLVKSFNHLSEEDLSLNNCWPVNLDKRTKTEKIINLVKEMDPENIYSNCLKCINASGWDDGHVSCAIKYTSVPYTESKVCKHYKVVEA
jgi:hypothetical protein